MNLKRTEFSTCIKNEDRYFLFNSLYGNLDEVDKDLFHILAKNRTIDSKIKNKNELIIRNHLQEGNRSQFKEFVRMYEKYSKECKKTIRFYIPLSYSCNLSCTYCFQKDISSQRQLSYENLDKIFRSIEYINAETKNKNHSIVIYGGEPLLEENRHKIETILKFSQKNNIAIELITNGINIKKFLKMLISYKNIINTVTVTLDGDKKNHDACRKFRNGSGSYDIINYGLLLLRKNNIEYNIRVNLNKQVLNSFNLSEIDSDVGNINLYRVVDKNRSNMCTLLDIYKLIEDDNTLLNNSCLNIVNYFYYLINDFDSYPLFRFCDSEHIFLYSLDGKTIYNCNEKESINKQIGNYLNYDYVDLSKIENLRYDPMCMNCTVLPLCGGGCPFKRGNSTCFKECSYYKEILELINYYIQKTIKECV